MQTALIISLVIVPALLVWFRNSSGAGVVAAAIAAALLFTRLPDISSLRLFGLAANLEHQTQQAQVTLAQLQQLAASLAQGSLEELAFSGQSFEGLSNSAKFTVHDSIISSLITIGLPPQQIRRSQAIWISGYGSLIENMIGSELAKDLSPSSAIAEEKKIDLISYRGDLPSADALAKLIGSYGVKDQKLFQLLEEYRNVLTDGSMKNPNLIPFGASFPAPQAQSLPVLPDGLHVGSIWNNGGVLGTVLSK